MRRVADGRGVEPEVRDFPDVFGGGEHARERERGASIERTDLGPRVVASPYQHRDAGPRHGDAHVSKLSVPACIGRVIAEQVLIAAVEIDEVERLRGAMLWLTAFSGAFVFMEPSPYEIAALLAIIVFALTGMTLRASIMPLEELPTTTSALRMALM